MRVYTEEAPHEVPEVWISFCAPFAHTLLGASSASFIFTTASLPGVPLPGFCFHVEILDNRAQFRRRPGQKNVRVGIEGREIQMIVCSVRCF